MRQSAGAAPALTAAFAGQSAAAQATRPNIVIIISDQFRGDAIGAAGQNPMGLTPNLDAMARRGTLFHSAIATQPVCAPTRASIFTGQYPEKHGVWKNGIALPEKTTTLATVLREAGYSANYIGKWHLGLAGEGHSRQSVGPVAAQYRGGFLDLWEASNELEWTSHAYEGELYDGDNRPISFKDVYRADFITGRVRQFVGRARAPFLLVASYLEVHHQNDTDSFDPPRNYVGRYNNPFIPHDLRPLRGSWQQQLPDYFALVSKMDAEVGEILRMLREQNLDSSTIVVFVSDHGCHFKTRNTEYKRSPHESSIHVPLIVQGMNFNGGHEVKHLVSHVDLMPTLLSAAGLAVPAGVQGRSFLPLIEGNLKDWRDEVYVTMSEFMTARALRTPGWTYAVAAPKGKGWKSKAAAEEYFEYMLYDLAADPFQHVNLAGTTGTRKVAAELREQLLKRMEEASGKQPVIGDCFVPVCLTSGRIVEPGGSPKA